MEIGIETYEDGLCCVAGFAGSDGSRLRGSRGVPGLRGQHFAVSRRFGVTSSHAVGNALAPRQRVRFVPLDSLLHAGKRCLQGGTAAAGTMSYEAMVSLLLPFRREGVRRGIGKSRGRIQFGAR